jgi:hypothetical protein
MAVILLITLSAAANGQEGAALSRVTLYSEQGPSSRSKALINFDTGALGGFGSRLNDFDLSYGKISLNHDNDWLMVCDARSRIIDLGNKRWADFKRTPDFFKGRKPLKPLPLDAPMVFDASGGVKEHSPYQQIVQAKVGHMYMMRAVRGRKKFYVMFRVDSLTRGDWCLLSWKKVQQPEEAIEK